MNILLFKGQLTLSVTTMTDICCWWCCHTFPGPSLHYPYRYDDRTKKYMTTGHFCSWECIKAYALDENTARSGEIQMIIALMRKHSNGNKYVPCRPAPKRPTLKMFGGTLTIDEFRSGSSNVVVTMPWETHIIPILTTSAGATARSVPTIIDAPTDNLVIRRNKPLARTKSSLEASLGIIRKTR